MGWPFFNPGNHWVSGAMVVSFGNMGPGATKTWDVILSIAAKQQRTRR